MSNDPSSVPDLEAMPFTEAFKKFKRLKLFGPSLGVLFVSVCVILCFVYLDYRAVAKGFRFPVQSERFMWLQKNNNGSGKDLRVEFLGDKGGECDMFDGDWVWDESYPLYQSNGCPFLDEGFECSESGCPDCFTQSGDGNPEIATCPG